MKRKLDKKKLVLEQNTVTVLTPDQFGLVIGGGTTDKCPVHECACPRDNLSRRC